MASEAENRNKILPLLLPSCVTLGKFLHLSTSVFLSINWE